MLMLASVFFIACEDDEGKDPLTAEEAKQEMETLGTQMNTMMDNMENVEGINVMMVLNSMPYPFEETSKKAEVNKKVLENIGDYLVPKSFLGKKIKNLKEPDFDFEYWCGTYDWNAEHQMWEIDFDNPADKIIINFPATETSTTNDASLTIHNYEEVEITYGYDTWNDIKDIEADLYVDGTKLVGLDMSATWITSGDYAGEPVEMDVDVYLIPFNFHVDFSHGSTTAKANAWIEYNGDKIFSVGADATFASSNMDDSPTKISGYIQLFDVKFKATVAFAELEGIIDAIDEGTSPYTTIDEMETAINATIDAEVTVDGAKAADIVLDFTTTPSAYSFTIDEDDGIYLNILFVYSNGSSESAVPYFVTFIASVEEFFGTLEGYYN